MTSHDQSWRTHELEQFHDGELDQARSAQLAEALLRDAALRERLAEVARVDRAIGAALTRFSAAESGKRSRAGTRNPSRVSRMGIAACLLIGAVAIAVIAVQAIGPRAAPKAIDIAAPAEAEPYRAVRVVFELPAEWVVREPEPLEAESQYRPSADGVSVAITRGDAMEALALLRGATPQEKAEVFRKLAALERSAAAARRVLDALDAEDQLAACAVWAEEPWMRPIAFERLSALSQREDLSARFEEVVRLLGERADLEIWMKSYGVAQAGRKADARAGG